MEGKGHEGSTPRPGTPGSLCVASRGSLVASGAGFLTWQLALGGIEAERPGSCGARCGVGTVSRPPHSTGQGSHVPRRRGIHLSAWWVQPLIRGCVMLVAIGGDGLPAQPPRCQPLSQTLGLIPGSPHLQGRTEAASAPTRRGVPTRCLTWSSCPRTSSCSVPGFARTYLTWFLPGQAPFVPTSCGCIPCVSLTCLVLRNLKEPGTWLIGSQPPEQDCIGFVFAGPASAPGLLRRKAQETGLSGTGAHRLGP